MQYGYWKVRVIQKHRLPASWRHLVPAAFLLTLIALVLASAFSPAARLGLLLALGAYALCTLAASAMTAASTEGKLLPVLPVVFACFHFGYGWGFLRGVWDFMIWRRRPAKQMSAISRPGRERQSLPSRTRAG
jgi:hypothetical protein